VDGTTHEVDENKTVIDNQGLQYRALCRGESANHLHSNGWHAQQLVAAHHGYIDLAPTTTGTTVVVTLPASTDAH